MIRSEIGISDCGDHLSIFQLRTLGFQLPEPRLQLFQLRFQFGDFVIDFVQRFQIITSFYPTRPKA